jgi:hypothetical protein
VNLLDLADAIVREHQAVGGAAQVAVHHAWRAGEFLLQAKKTVRHGKWLHFLKCDCSNLASRTAQGYMCIARHWSMIEADANTRGGAYLSIHEALRLVASSRISEPRSYRAPKVTWAEVKPAERRELRRIAAELHEFPYSGKSYTPAGRGRGGDLIVTGGAAGAPVYWDIVGGNPDDGRPTFTYTRRDVLEKLCTLFIARKRSIVSDLVVDVARRRLAGDRYLQPAFLPPEAGDFFDPTWPPDIFVAMTGEERAECHLLLEQFDSPETLLTVLRQAFAEGRTNSRTDHAA